MHFEKSAIMMSWRPSWIFYENENNFKSHGTPFIFLFIKSRQDWTIFEEVNNFSRNAHFTYGVMAAIFKIVNLQF